LSAVSGFSRILFTGADGFVGPYLLSALHEALPPSTEIVIASRTGGGDANHEHVRMELTEPRSVTGAVRHVAPDLVIHLAAQASVGQSWDAAADTWGINLCGSFHLASAMASHVPDSTMLYVSTAEVYGRGFNAGRASESTVVEPLSAYARSKAATEAMLRDVLPASTRLIVTRPSNHSGPGQDRRFVIPDFAAQIVRVERGEAESIDVGNLDARRDFMDVRDVVAAYVALLGKAPELPSRSLFNIGTGRAIRIGDLLDRLRGMSEVSVPVRQDPARMRPSEIATAAIDASALRTATGWRPVRELDDMLAMALSEMRATADLR